MRTAALVVIALVFVLPSGCYYDSQERLYPSNCDTTNVTYSGTIRALMQSRCAIPGCHVANGAPGDFTTYAGLKADVDNGKVNNRVLVLQNMPSSGALGACDQNKLRDWINRGSQNN